MQYQCTVLSLETYLGLVDVPGTHIVVFFSFRFFEVLP